MTVQKPDLAHLHVGGHVHHESASAQTTSLVSGTARPLRLLFVTPRYLPFIGGVEHHVHQVAERLARAGVDVTILTADPSGQLPTEERVGGVNVRRVRAWPAKRDYYFAPRMYSIITREGWDIVHLQSYHTLVAPLAMLAALRARLPYVVTFHGGGHSSWLRNMLRGAQRALLRPLLARAERLVAIAKFEIRLYSKQLRVSPHKFVLIPNGADLPKAQPPQTVPDATLLVSIGRLERYKGHHRVIAALPHILKQRPDARLWIAGAGPYEKDLRQLAHKLGVADQVDIRAIPATERDTMAAEVSKAALVVLLSDYETHPIAVLEALALGVPALVADTSGLSELAEQGLVRAVALQSTPQEVATAVLDQLRQPLPPASVQLPTWDDCAAGLLALYHAIMGRL